MRWRDGAAETRAPESARRARCRPAHALARPVRQRLRDPDWRRAPPRPTCRASGPRTASTTRLEHHPRRSPRRRSRAASARDAGSPARSGKPQRRRSRGQRREGGPFTPHSAALAFAWGSSLPETQGTNTGTESRASRSREHAPEDAGPSTYSPLRRRPRTAPAAARPG